MKPISASRTAWHPAIEATPDAMYAVYCVLVAGGAPPGNPDPVLATIAAHRRAYLVLGDVI
jgi:hypothetical protein